MQAPALKIAQWFNTKTPITLDSLRGKVVVLHAFQMLCPGCVHYGIPQTQRIYERFNGPDVAVLGLHSVFEHHDVMTPAALGVFIHENRLKFPIGVDMPGENGGTPLTMRDYQLQGTPTLILIDRDGNKRFQQLGHSDDLAVGVAIGRLLERTPQASEREATQGQM